MELLIPATASPSPFLSAPSSPGMLSGVTATAGAFDNVLLTSPPANPVSPPGESSVSHRRPGRQYGFSFDSRYASAPVSPARSASIFADFAEDDEDGEYRPMAMYSARHLAVPFNWEEKPGTPKSCYAPAATSGDDSDNDDFEFAGNTASSRELTTADTLFEEGVIKTLKPPPRLQSPTSDVDRRSCVSSSPRSPRRPGIFGPRRRSRTVDTFDPFLAAVQATSKESPEAAPVAAVSPSRKLSPLSPLRNESTAAGAIVVGKTAGPPRRSPATDNGGKKWKLINMLFFRKEPAAKPSLPPATMKTNTSSAGDESQEEKAPAAKPLVQLTWGEKRAPTVERIPLPLPPARRSIGKPAIEPSARRNRRSFGSYSSFGGGGGGGRDVTATMTGKA